MPIKILIVALLILVSGIANAEDKRDAFKKAVDYCNCRIANTYCRQYSDMNPESEERVSYDNIYHIFKCSISHSLPYDSINNILRRNSFSLYSKKSSTVMSRILKEEVELLSTEEAVSRIVSGIYESAEFKDIVSQYSEVGSLKESLTKEVREYLKQSFGAIQSPVSSDSNTEVSQVETQFQMEINRLENLIESNRTSSFSVNWLSIILMIVLSGAIYVVLKLKISDLEERTNRHRNELNSIETKNSGVFNLQSNQNSSINEFMRSVERQISDLNSAISSLQSENVRLSMRAQSQSDLHQPFSNSTLEVEKQKRVEVLFAPIPNRDGSFNASKVTSAEDQSASFYKFTITDSLSQKATFEFLNVERAIKDATSSPELILNPVCRVKNALNQNAKRIKTVKPGTVARHNDKWIVDQPAEIEYE